MASKRSPRRLSRPEVSIEKTQGRIGLAYLRHAKILSSINKYATQPQVQSQPKELYKVLASVCAVSRELAIAFYDAWPSGETGQSLDSLQQLLNESMALLEKAKIRDDFSDGAEKHIGSMIDNLADRLVVLDKMADGDGSFSHRLEVQALVREQADSRLEIAMSI